LFLAARIVNLTQVHSDASGDVTMQNNAQKLAYSIDDIVKLVGVGRSLLFEEIKAGRLPVKKAGRRTLVTDSALKGWLSNLPAKSAGRPKLNQLNPETHK
jgi:hypothetical protein